MPVGHLDRGVAVPWNIRLLGHRTDNMHCILNVRYRVHRPGRMAENVIRHQSIALGILPRLQGIEQIRLKVETIARVVPRVELVPSLDERIPADLYVLDRLHDQVPLHGRVLPLVRLQRHGHLQGRRDVVVEREILQVVVGREFRRGHGDAGLRGVLGDAEVPAVPAVLVPVGGAEGHDGHLVGGPPEPAVGRRLDDGGGGVDVHRGWVDGGAHSQDG